MLWRTLFGARAQIIVGCVAFGISWCFWILGTFIIPGAASWPWNWTPSVYIFHASMFALVVASYAIIATGLGYLKTEHVETKVANIEDAGTVTGEEVHVDAGG